jgi:hypothetical protein
MTPQRRKGGRLYILLLGVAAGLLIANIVPAGRIKTIVVSQNRNGGDASGPGSVTGTTGPGGAQGPGGVATGPGSGGVHGPGGAGGPNGATVRGVTPTKIKIGIGIPDLGVVKALGPDYDVGNPREQMEAVLQGWKDRGLVPINGRDVEFDYRSYDIVGTQQQRAACEGWATDDKVFTVLAVSNFWAQSDCLTKEYRLSLISSDEYYESNFQGGRLFTLQPSYEKVFSNWMYWAHNHNLLQGKKIGLYYAAASDSVAMINRSLKAALIKLGYGPQIVSEVRSSNIATGSSEDTIAADKFCAAGVTMAILVAGALNQTNFMYEADSQNCHPSYIESDFLYSTNDTAAHTFPKSQADGIYGMTSFRFGEESAGMGLSAPAEACASNYAKYSGKHVVYRDAPAEWLFMEEGCDLADIMLKALQRAGRNLTESTFFAAMNQTRREVLGSMSDATFRAGKLGAADYQRTVQWHADCVCWKAIGRFEPYYVP